MQSPNSGSCSRMAIVGYVGSSRYNMCYILRSCLGREGWRKGGRETRFYALCMIPVLVEV